MSLSEWIFAFASVTGESHVSENLPCQDSCRVAQHPDFCILIVCDGAGSCENSHLGSAFVCDSMVTQLESLVNFNNWGSSDLPSEESWKTLAAEALLCVKEDLLAFAFENSLDFKSLSCTVIAAVILKKGILVTHIGDGRAGYCNEEDEWFSIITPFHGSEANETVFITSSVWNDGLPDTYIESRIIHEKVKAICLLSDGGEKAAFECNLYDNETGIFYDPNKPYKNFFHRNITVHLPALKDAGKSQEEINGLWKSFLKSGNEKLKNEPDDKTIILGVRYHSPE